MKHSSQGKAVMILTSHSLGKYMAPNYYAIKHIWSLNFSYIIWA